MKHSEVYADHSYLWDIGAANDMTGGYVDSEDLDVLLKNPSKKTAKECLIRQMAHWFFDGVEPAYGGNGGVDPHNFEDEYPRIREIAEKYNFDY